MVAEYLSGAFDRDHADYRIVCDLNVTIERAIEQSTLPPVSGATNSPPIEGATFLGPDGTGTIGFL